MSNRSVYHRKEHKAIGPTIKITFSSAELGLMK